MLVVPVDELPEMQRGQGVTLQKYRAGSLSDATIFTREDGLSWQLGSKTRTEPDITPWLGKRGSAGKLPPVGFPRSNKFE